MSQLAATLTVTPASKSGSWSVDLAYGDKPLVTISGVAAYTSADLVLSVLSLDGETTYATCSAFTAYVGTLNLHTTELQEFFADLGPRARRRFLCTLWDSGTNALLMSDSVRIENNPVADNTGEATPAATVINDIQAKLGKLPHEGDDTTWHPVEVGDVGDLVVGDGEEI